MTDCAPEIRVRSRDLKDYERLRWRGGWREAERHPFFRSTPG